MAGATLGTAYVQIIPSADGIKSKIKQELEPEMSSSGQASGLTLGKNLVSKLKGVIGAAAIGKFIKDAITAGGQLQQSIGGIETLFAKNNAFKIVESNAKKAFKNVGISANQYMKDVTGFAATLISGCAGDTNKAAKYADVAMRDMADNANKMGTDMGSIRYAYQGFAKQNYTMLDNLKLGYGGTASEMARLVNDSGVLGKGVKVTADTVKNVPFNKIIEAIHKTQQGLGITGTTAKEAATTFTGSFGMMSAAWQDFLAQLATGGDVKGAMKNLASSVETFVKGNLIPMLKNIAKGLPAAFQVIEDTLPQLIAVVAPIAVKLVAAVATGIAKSAPVLMNAFLKVLLALLKVIPQIPWGQMAGQIMTAIGQGFQTNALGMIALLSGVGVKGAKGLIKGIGGVKDAVTIVKGVKDKIAGLPALISGTKEEAAVKSLFSKLKSGFSTGFSTVKDIITQNGSSIKQAASQAFNGLKNVGSSAFNGLKNVGSAAFNGLKTVGSAAINGLKGAISGIGSAFSALGSFLAANPFVLIIAAIAAAVAALVLLYNKSETFRNFVNGAAAAIKGAVIGAWNGIKGALSTVGSFLAPIGNAIKNAFTHPIQTAKNIWNAFVNIIKGVIDKAKAIVAAWKPHIPHVNNPLASLFGWVSGIIGKAKAKVASWKPHLPHVNNPFASLGGWVQNAWNKLTSFRPHIPKISIGFGHIKLPHFHLSGKFDLKKGKVPHLGINWYAKGGIFNAPSVIGVGEAGPEAVLPIEKLQTMLDRNTLYSNRADSNNLTIERKLDMVLAIMRDILAATDQPTVLDSGEIVSVIDKRLGKLAARRVRQ
jgi:phage-related protein